MFHGLRDRVLLPGALNDTWKWAEKHLTLVTVPGPCPGTSCSRKRRRSSPRQ